MIFGLDVSKWQGTIDWVKVAAAGVKFAFARAAVCTLPDQTFAVNLAGMRKAGVLPGAYHYLYPAAWETPEDQADLFLETVGDPTGVLLAVDAEYHGLLDGVATKVVLSDVERFVNRVHEKFPAHPIFVYTGEWYWVGWMGNPTGAHLGALWNSRYVTVDDGDSRTLTALYAKVNPAWWDPDYGKWPEATLLQFTSKARVAGIDGNVDGDAFLGTLDDLGRYAGEAMQSFLVPEQPTRVMLKEDPTRPGNSVWMFTDDTFTKDGLQTSLEPIRFLNLVGETSAFAIVAYEPSSPDTNTTSKAMYVRPTDIAKREVTNLDCSLAVKTAVDPLNVKIASLTSQVATLTATVAAHVKTIAAQAAQITSQYAQITALTARVNELNAKVATLTAQLAQSVKDLAVVRASLAAAESVLKVARSAISALVNL